MDNSAGAEAFPAIEPIPLSHVKQTESPATALIFGMYAQTVFLGGVGFPWRETS